MTAAAGYHGQGVHVTGNRIHVFAPAKVNMFLNILGLREDGYHDIESVMLKTDWGDLVSMGIGRAPRGMVTIRVPGYPELENENNLAVRAVQWFRQRSPFEEGVHIHLQKRIPAQSGLGGGSSDAAAVLRGLAAWSEMRLENLGTLTDIATGLGADVPLFVRPGHGIVRGIGDVVEPLDFGRNLFVLIAIPHARANTGEMYKNWDELSGELSGNEINLTHFVDSVKNYVDYKCGLYGLSAKIANAFLPVVERRYPAMYDAFCKLTESSSRTVGLSGSGSALFAVFERRYQAERLAHQINRQRMFAAVEVVSILHC